MDDLISRQDAIENVTGEILRVFDVSINKAYGIAENALENLPPAHPQRTHGRWIVIPGMNEQCSECGKFFPLSYFKDRPFEINFCPHCGADMREESNGSISN